MKKAINIYNQIEEKFCTYSFFIVIVLIFVQVICRQLGIALTWSEELCRYLYVWECWIGVSLTQREDRHIKLLFLVERTPEKVQYIVGIIATILSVVCAGVLAYLGFQLVFFTAELGTFSPVLKIPMGVFYLCLPLGCVAYILRVIGQEISKIAAHRRQVLEEGGEE